MINSYKSIVSGVLYFLNFLADCNVIYCRIDKAMKGLEERLEAAYKASGGRKVNIISHSMGGLLVTCFMHLHGDVRICS